MRRVAIDYRERIAYPGRLVLIVLQSLAELIMRSPFERSKLQYLILVCSYRYGNLRRDDDKDEDPDKQDDATSPG